MPLYASSHPPSSTCVDDQHTVRHSQWLQLCSKSICTHASNLGTLYPYNLWRSIIFHVAAATLLLHCCCCSCCYPPPLQNRNEILQQAASDGNVKDYGGWRVSLKGKRFKIKDVRLFNVTELDGEH